MLEGAGKPQAQGSCLLAAWSQEQPVVASDKSAPSRRWARNPLVFKVIREASRREKSALRRKRGS